MFVAHAPVGFLVGRAVARRWSHPWLVPVSILGSLAPDVDLALSGLRVHHHDWPTHWPVAWLLVGASLAPLVVHPRSRTAGILGLVLVGNALLHLILDSVVGDVRWLAPWSFHGFALVHLRRALEPWWLNFLLHPSFGLELVLVGVAAWVLARRWRSG